MSPTLRVAHALQTVSLTNAEAENLVVALIVSGDSTNLQRGTQRNIIAIQVMSRCSLREKGDLGFLFQVEEEAQPPMKTPITFGHCDICAF